MSAAELASRFGWDDVAPVLAFLLLAYVLHAARRRWRRMRSRAISPRRSTRRAARQPTAASGIRSGGVRRLAVALLAAGALGTVGLSGATWWTNWAPGGTGTPHAGVVTHVRDGDTIEVARRPVRLSGLTCDERGTPLGDRATAALRRLVQGRVVQCMLNGERTHDREVGRCRLPNGDDLGAMLIAGRLCGRCARHDPGRDYATLQAEVGPYPGASPGYCWAPW